MNDGLLTPTFARKLTGRSPPVLPDRESMLFGGGGGVLDSWDGHDIYEALNLWVEIDELIVHKIRRAAETAGDLEAGSNLIRLLRHGISSRSLQIAVL